MDAKLFLSTFVLIFVAELGDKTQLAVINMTAKHKMPIWAAPALEEASAPSVVARFVFDQALVFEEAAERDYRRLAEASGDGALRKLLLALADEEAAHVAHLKASMDTESDAAFGEEAAALPDLEDLVHDVSDDAQPVIQHAVEHERATAAFYEELARVTHLPSLRPLFARLAREERQHAERLEDLVGDEA